MADQSISSRHQMLFELALEDYEINTKISLVEHPLAQELEDCHSVESIITLLQDQARSFGEFRGKERVMKSIESTISFLYKLSSTAALDDGISMALHTGLGVLLTAAKGVTDSYDALVDLLQAIEHFLKPLDIYTEVPPTPAMYEILVKIMLELLSTLGLATKELKQGRSKEFVQAIFGRDKNTKAALQRLDRLALDEARTTAAEILKVVYSLVQDINGKASGDAVREALTILHETASDMAKSKRDKLVQDIRNWLSPPDPWKNHTIARASHYEGTATWFIQGDTFSEWKSAGPSGLLWIHGKPGVGKSVLCSTIIEQIDDMKKCGLASLAFFYCDFREDQNKEGYERVEGE